MEGEEDNHGKKRKNSEKKNQTQETGEVQEEKKVTWQIYDFRPDAIKHEKMSGFYVSPIGIGPEYPEIKQSVPKKFEEWEGYDTRVWQRVADANMVKVTTLEGIKRTPTNPKFEAELWYAGNSIITKLNEAFDAATENLTNPGTHPFILEIADDEKLKCSTWPTGPAYVEIKGIFYVATPTLERISYEWKKKFIKKGKDIDPLFLVDTIEYYSNDNDTLKKIGRRFNVPLMVMSALNSTRWRGKPWSLRSRLEINTLVLLPNPPGSDFRKMLKANAALQPVNDTGGLNRTRFSELTTLAANSDKKDSDKKGSDKKGSDRKRRKTMPTFREEDDDDGCGVKSATELTGEIQSAIGAMDAILDRAQLLAQLQLQPPPAVVKRLRLQLKYDPELSSVLFSMPADSTVQDTVLFIDEILKKEGLANGKKVINLKNAEGSLLLMSEVIQNVLVDKEMVVPEYEKVAVAHSACNGAAAN